MNPAVAEFFRLALYVLIALIIARSLMTWFPVSPRNQFVQFLDRVTEPLLAPFRRLIPPIGIFDVSSMVVIILLYIMIQVVGAVAAR